MRFAVIASATAVAAAALAAPAVAAPQAVNCSVAGVEVRNPGAPSTHSVCVSRNRQREDVGGATGVKVKASGSKRVYVKFMDGSAATYTSNRSIPGKGVDFIQLNP